MGIVQFFTVFTAPYRRSHGRAASPQDVGGGALGSDYVPDIHEYSLLGCALSFD